MYNLNSMEIKYSKENIKIIVAVAVFVVLAMVMVWKWAYPARFSPEFAGSVQRVEGNYIYAKGNFTVPDHLEEYYKPAHTKEVKILISSETEIVKWLIYNYNAPLANKPSDSAKKYREEKIVGNVEDLKQGVPIKVVADENVNIFNKDEFTAARVEYMHIVSYYESVQP